jgi:hypothetical protein
MDLCFTNRKQQEPVKITVRLKINVTHGTLESEQHRAEQHSRGINV